MLFCFLSFSRKRLVLAREPPPPLGLCVKLPCAEAVPSVLAKNQSAKANLTPSFGLSPRKLITWCGRVTPPGRGKRSMVWRVVCRECRTRIEVLEWCKLCNLQKKKLKARAGLREATCGNFRLQLFSMFFEGLSVLHTLCLGMSLMEF